LVYMSDTKLGDPLLTVIIPAANDNYNDDNLFRIETMLNLSCSYLHRLGRAGEVEFVLVDYSSKVHLSKVLTLLDNACTMTRFFYIKENSPSGAIGINLPLSVNVGLKRARGRYVAIQAADLLMSLPSWGTLLGILDRSLPVRLHDLDLDNRMLLTPRKLIPESFFSSKPSLNEVDIFLSGVSGRTPFFSDYYPSIGSGAGQLIASNQHWRALGGCDERFIKWGFTDNDLIVRSSRFSPPLDLGSMGIFNYKPEYSGQGRRKVDSFRGVPIERNPWWVNPESSANENGWGEVATVIEERCDVRTQPKLTQPASKERPKSHFFPKLRTFDESDTKQIFSGGTTPVPPFLFEAMLYLDTVVNNLHPLSVLIAGADQDSAATRVVIRSNPVCSLIILDVQETAMVGQAPSGLLELTEPLQEFRHIGRTWLLSGRWSTIRTALFNDIADNSPQLIFVKSWCFEPLFDLLERLFSCINTGLCIIIAFKGAGESEDFIKDFIRKGYRQPLERSKKRFIVSISHP